MGGLLRGACGALPPSPIFRARAQPSQLATTRPLSATPPSLPFPHRPSSCARNQQVATLHADPVRHTDGPAPPCRRTRRGARGRHGRHDAAGARGMLPRRCVPRRTLAGASPPLGARPLRTAGHPRRALHHLRALGALLGHLRLHRQQRAAVFCRPPLKVARLRHARRARQGALNPPRRRSTPTLAPLKTDCPTSLLLLPHPPHPLSRAGRDARQDAKGWQTGRPSSRYQRVAPHALVAPPPPPLRRPNPRRTPVAHPRRARCRPTTTSASTRTGAHALRGVRGGG